MKRLVALRLIYFVRCKKEVWVGDIINFPAQAVREWAEIERSIRDIFTQVSAPVEMQNEVLNRMKDIFQRYNVKFGVPIEFNISLSPAQQEAINLSLGRAFEGLGKQMQDFTNQILFDRLLIEIELYKLRHG